jgi:predicted nucleic-acid-binding Zn-ribbon protein
MVEKCPKCGGDMVRGDRLVAHTRVLASVSLAKRGDILGDSIIPYYCENCGYIEFYKEIKGVKHQNAFLKKCVKCGKKIPIASEECQYCGAKQKKGVKS